MADLPEFKSAEEVAEHVEELRAQQDEAHADFQQQIYAAIVSGHETFGASAMARALGVSRSRIYQMGIDFAERYAA